MTKKAITKLQMKSSTVVKSEGGVTGNFITNLSDNSCVSELDNTILEYMNLINKENLVAEDVSNGRFITEFSPEKRNGKMKLLKEEFFDDEVYQNNQCGFNTSRPMVWIEAFELTSQ